jgi:hypothetical protein
MMPKSKALGESGLRGADRLIIYRNGDVIDEHGEDLGNPR